MKLPKRFSLRTMFVAVAVVGVSGCGPAFDSYETGVVGQVDAAMDREPGRKLPYVYEVTTATFRTQCVSDKMLIVGDGVLLQKNRASAGAWFIADKLSTHTFIPPEPTP